MSFVLIVGVVAFWLVLLWMSRADAKDLASDEPEALLEVCDLDHREMLGYAQMMGMGVGHDKAMRTIARVRVDGWGWL